MDIKGRAGSGQHQPAGVDDDEDGLTSLHLVDFADQLAMAGGGRPADITDLVGIAILAQAFEITATPQKSLQAFLLLDLAATHQVKRIALRFAQVGINANRLAEFRDGPALCEPEGSVIAQIDAPDQNV